MHIYLSQKDAQYIVAMGVLVAPALCAIIALLDGPLPFADIIIIGATGLIATTYWKESNNDGSLDVKIPYSSVITHKIKIGSNWYRF